MTKAVFPSLKDGGITQNCWVHDARGLDDEAFESIFGEPKDSFPKCSNQQENLKGEKQDEERIDFSDPNYMQSLQKNTTSNTRDYNEMPQYEHVVRLTGNGAIKVCSNHYGITMGSQVAMEKNLGRLRPQLNPGESNESQYRINHRKNLIADRARKAWNAIIGERFNQKRSPFSLQSQEDNKAVERISPQERLNRMISAGWGEDPKDEKVDPSAMGFDKNYTHPDLDEENGIEEIELNPNIQNGKS
jgi:hypothetical protein